MFEGPFDESIIKRAQEKNLVQIKIHDLRDWAVDSRRTVDDKPYGGGTGMVLRVDVVDRALGDIKNQKSKINNTDQKSKIILLSPRGKVFNQKKAREFSKLDHLIFICGHYEGVDERVSEHIADEEVSIGDYVLTGGEIPAMAVVDSIVRLIPGVLEKPDATISESFSNSQLVNLNIRNLLEYPQYTRPENFKGWKVPEILLSGDHKKIEEWREQKSQEKTKQVRPELLSKKHE